MGALPPLRIIMTIDEVITVLQNRLTNLQNARYNAVNAGQMDVLTQMDIDILTVTSTLAKIQSVA
jgi:hypothetical protein